MIQTVDSILKQLAIYYGIPIFIFGIIGTILNIIIFMSSKTFRSKSCVFYLTIMSIFDLGRLLTSALSNILALGFGIDLGLSSLFICKIRIFLINICSLGSITCLALAIIVQYFTIRSRSNERKWYNIKQTYRLLGIFLILWILHALPYLIYYDHILLPSTNKIICQITNQRFIQYHTFGYFLILTNLLPFIGLIFGLLAYYHVKYRNRPNIPSIRYELDKEFILMILIQILIYFLTFLPYSIQSMCALLIKNTDPLFANKMKLASIITLHISILSYTTSFYIYLCVSKYFRRRLKYILYDRYFKQTESIQLTLNEEIFDQQ